MIMSCGDQQVRKERWGVGDTQEPQPCDCDFRHTCSMCEAGVQGARALGVGTLMVPGSGS